MPEMCVFFLDVKSFELACFHELKHCILKAQHTNGVVQLRSHGWFVYSIAEEFPLVFLLPHPGSAASRRVPQHNKQLKSTSIFLPR